MELTVYQYSFLLFGLFSLALGISMLVCWPSGSIHLDKYRGSKIVFGATFTLISIGNCYRMYNSAFGKVPQVYADFLSPYVLAVVLMLIVLFGYSFLSLYRSDYVNYKAVFVDVAIVVPVMAIYFIHEKDNLKTLYNREYFFNNITQFAMYWRLIMLLVAAGLLIKYTIWIEHTRKIFVSLIEMYFSEADRYSLPWVRRAYYCAVSVGFLAIICVILNWQPLFVLFVVVLLTFMFFFVMSYLMYPITYFDICSVIEAPESLRLVCEEEVGLAGDINGRIEKWKQRRGYTHFNINVVRMSEDMACSQQAILSYLHNNGKVFYSWIAEMRMAEAKKRIMAEGNRIDLFELSFDLGYSSYHVFANEFEKCEGVMPDEWMKTNAK